ncbi:MAG: hypothetical protein O3C60_20170 [Planctomycetota bacterium]|nr:hypothetical protein [Planctomycetota bacterium]
MTNGTIPASEIDGDFLCILAHHLPFLQDLHARNSLAPLAASLQTSGEVLGNAFTVQEGGKSPSFQYVLSHFAQQFRAGFRQQTIRAAAFFFHGCVHNDAVREARTMAEANSIVAWLEHASGQSIEAVIRYSLGVRSSSSDAVQWIYDPPVFRSNPVAVTSFADDE